ncbi:MAG TPA: transcription termination/antitermination NusG family protein [Gemmata sp.]|jgi:transcriptional antiterminator RfaH|nr:transcription termination/antitermination NusG family protein [Gemmata sp.]
MPILVSEPMVYPHDLFSPGEAMKGRWWVFQTRARAEKSFARLLVKSGTPYFLPTYVHRWKKSGRTFQSQLPLFPGYVFVAGDNDARSAAFATRLVVREVPATDHEQLASELVSVHAVLNGGVSARPETSLPKGQRVVIVEGPYIGIEGKVLDTSEGLRVCVEVSLLGQGVSVGIERWMLRALDSENAISGR